MKSDVEISNFWFYVAIMILSMGLSFLSFFTHSNLWVAYSFAAIVSALAVGRQILINKIGGTYNELDG